MTFKKVFEKIITINYYNTVEYDRYTDFLEELSDFKYKDYTE